MSRNFIYTPEPCMCGADDCIMCNPQNFAGGRYRTEEWFEEHPACVGCQKSRCDACMSEC